MCLSLPSIKCLAASPSLRLLLSTVRCLNCAQRFDYRALGSSRRLGGAAEHLIDGSEKRICWLSLEFYSPHVIERHSKLIAVSGRKNSVFKFKGANIQYVNLHEQFRP